METLALRTTYPCCGGRATLAALVGIPRETYARTCPKCGTTFSVERTQLSALPVRLDRLEWLDTASRLYTHTYGSK